MNIRKNETQVYKIIKTVFEFPNCSFVLTNGQSEELEDERHMSQLVAELDDFGAVLHVHDNVLTVEVDGVYSDRVLRLLEDIFGIAARASRIDLMVPLGHELLETTDSINRVLTLEAVDEDTLRDADTTETLWTFAPPSTQEAGCRA